MAGTAVTAGTAGAAGAGEAGEASGGAGGTACGEPPVVPRDECDARERDQQGDDGFTLSSPDFDDCGEIPAKNSCDGHDFGTGDSPKFTWTGAPAGTKSFAAVFKDISLSNDAATERLGYHWVMWDIPADTTELPAGMKGGYESEDIPGAHQWSSLGSYGFFTPCPNPFPRDNAAPPFSCMLSQDSYSLTLYALSEETLDDLPAVELDDMNMPVKNWVVAMGHYIEGLDALAVTEYRGTSKAWASQFVPPNAEKFPCTQDMGAAGVASTCLH
jgi:phosphatidylethanolamine-binding protein (PEBP) family uncharacterized protein